LAVALRLEAGCVLDFDIDAVRGSFFNHPQGLLAEGVDRGVLFLSILNQLLDLAEVPHHSRPLLYLVTVDQLQTHHCRLKLRRLAETGCEELELPQDILRQAFGCLAHHFQEILLSLQLLHFLIVGVSSNSCH